MNYIQDLTGAEIPIGRITRTPVDWSPGWAAQPSTLIVDSGTGTVLPPSSSTGQLKLSGSATKLRLRTSADLDMGRFDEITWTVQGGYLSASTGMHYGISVENDAGLLGCSFYQADTDATAQLRLGQPSGTPIRVFSQYDMNGSERLRHRNLTLQIRPATGEVRVFEDDQCVFDLPASARASLVLGQARACVTAGTTATTQAMYVSRVALSVTHS